MLRAGSRVWRLRTPRKQAESAFRERNNKAQGCMRCGEAHYFMVCQSGGFSRVDHIDFANVGLTFGINDPNTTRFANRARERLQFREVLFRFRGKENQVRVTYPIATRI